MLKQSLIHIPGIGQKTEMKLWQAGVTRWTDLRATTVSRRAEVAKAIANSIEAYRNRNLAYFFSHLPAQQKWRTFIDFGEEFAGLDIETTGLSVYDKLTVIGIEMGGEYQTFVRGSNLGEAARVLESLPGLLTFNGTLFDLPFIRRTFPGITLPEAHLDLRFLGQRLGFRGGLKSVEEATGVQRPGEIEDVGGYAATVLWSRFEHGDLDALRLLIRYNAADTCVLRPLCRLFVTRFLQQLASEFEAATSEPFLFGIERPEFGTPETRPRHRVKEPQVRVGRDFTYVNGSKLETPVAGWEGPAVTTETLLGRMKRPSSRIVGIDLTGSDKKPSGWALLQEDLVICRTVRTDEEIIHQTLAGKPDLVSIDSPLSIPRGRCCMSDDCECRRHGITRECERELKRRGISVYWCLIQSMQGLTKRGIHLAQEFRKSGVEVIESFPGAAQDIMGIPRKRASLEQLRAGLEAFGIRGIPAFEDITHDELDAVTSAAVGAFYLAGMYEALGNPDEDYLIVPRFDQENAEPPTTGDKQMASSRLACVLILSGTGSDQAADELSGTLSLTRVRSLTEARLAFRETAKGVVTDEASLPPEQALAAFGSHARVVRLAQGRRASKRRDRFSCDLVLDREESEWRASLRGWIQSLCKEGTATCH